MTKDMEIEQRDEGASGAFVIERNGKRIAELTYRRSGAENIVLDHTFVGEELRGQGVGRDLVAAAVQWAREKQLRLVPRCSYARAALERETSWHDVLA